MIDHNYFFGMSSMITTDVFKIVLVSIEPFYHGISTILIFDQTPITIFLSLKKILYFPWTTQVTLFYNKCYALLLSVFARSFWYVIWLPFITQSPLYSPIYLIKKNVTYIYLRFRKLAIMEPGAYLEIYYRLFLVYLCPC